MLLLQVSEKCMAYSEKASLYRLLNANTIELLSVTDASSDSDIDTTSTQTQKLRCFKQLLPIKHILYFHKVPIMVPHLQLAA